MGTALSRFWGAAAAALLAMATGACAAHEPMHWPQPVHDRLVQLEVYDRADRTTLPVYAKDGRRYIVGTPGHEYAVRMRNRTAARVLVVTSVDGVNVITGETASPAQSGYVLDPWGSVEIIGWRKNLDRTAAFFFTEHRNSYAARTGRPHDVGVIGVAVFREKVQPIARDHHFRRGQVASEPAAPGEAGRAEAPAPSAGIRGMEDELAGRDSRESVRQPQAKLGTGHGRQETSHVRVVNFERASATPAETIAIQYDRRENLAAIGVLPSPIPLVRGEPQPFPGSIRFAPDPPR
jgi:hypothetical protein